MLGRISQAIRDFKREQKGVVLIIFVLLIVPLLLVIAVGIDFSQSLVVKRQLSNAVDAAALAIGTQQGLVDQEDMEAEAEKYIKVHYPENSIGTLSTFTVNRIGDPKQFEIEVSATAEVQTSFMAIGGVETLTVSAKSMVFRQISDLEVVMVLDNSGSMGSGNKLQDMKDAANTMVDVLTGDIEEPDNIRFGLVAFTNAVNVGVSPETPWLDKDVAIPASINRQLLNLPNFAIPEDDDDDDEEVSPAANNNPLANGSPPASTFDVLETMEGGIAGNWGGCVRSRFRHDLGIDDLDLTDTTPTPADPDTLFSALFFPFNGDDPNSYAGASSDQQNNGCGSVAIQPLTNVKSTITTAINSQVADGGTNIPEALAWGWRVISPTEPFPEGKAYGEQDVIKAIILLTDGQNAPGDFSSYGMENNPQLNATSADDKLAQLCENIKADHNGNGESDDIQLYTIGFALADEDTKDLLTACASAPNQFFDSTDAEGLENTFQIIAASLNQLRIKE